MKVKAYIHHKRAEKYCDCQDCFGIDFQNNRIAVSDGLSQSHYQRWWAKILVDAYLKVGHIPTDILPYQKKWQNQFVREIQERESRGANPWRQKNWLAEKSGAGATLCGFSWDSDKWTCECLGDSCVIIINDDYTLDFHTSQIGKFGSYPDYFDSFKAGRGSVSKTTGDFNAIAILIVTDPFSELFQKHKDDVDYIKARLDELQKLGNHESYVELVERWRDQLGMHNDDSTLVLLQDFSNIQIIPDDTANHIDRLQSLCEGDSEKTPNKAADESKLASVTDAGPILQTKSKPRDSVEDTLKWAITEVYKSYKPKSKKKLKKKVDKIIGQLIDRVFKK